MGPQPKESRAEMTATLLFSAMKNEGPFLLEWLAYHKVVGFEKIIVVTNNCDDGSERLLAQLAAAGEVVHFDHQLAPGQNPQGEAVAWLEASGLVAEGDWLLWLDGDEFFNSHIGQGDVKSLIEHIHPAQGILLPWRIFGDSGQEGLHQRFISPLFDRADELGSEHSSVIKTLFRYQKGKLQLGRFGSHRPVILAPKAFRATDFVTGAGLPPDARASKTKNWLAGGDDMNLGRLAPRETALTLAQINHYAVRTAALYELKKSRGRGFIRVSRSLEQQKRRHDAAYFERYNLNLVQDRSQLRHLPALEAEIARLLALPGVAHLQMEILALTAERMGLGRAGASARPEPAAEMEPPPQALPARAAEAAALPAKAAAPEDLYSVSKCVLDYGATAASLRLAKGFVMAVTSDPLEARALAQALPAEKGLVHHADIGPVGEWGRPIGRSQSQSFHLYPSAIWDHPRFRTPDLIVLRGRFRLACFLTAMARLESPATLLFETYEKRKKYHWIERYFTPQGFIGSTARFEITPMAWPAQDLGQILGQFQNWD